MVPVFLNPLLVLIRLVVIFRLSLAITAAQLLYRPRLLSSHKDIQRFFSTVFTDCFHSAQISCALIIYPIKIEQQKFCIDLIYFKMFFNKQSNIFDFFQYLVRIVP